jgi:hypothetical protein
MLGTARHPPLVLTERSSVSESLPELPSQSGSVPPRPAGRSRAASLIGAVAGAALLVAGVAACGGGSSPAKSSSGSSSNSGGSSVPTPATTPGPLSEPDQIATLQKAADQSVTNDLLRSMQATAKGAQISAVTYVDSSNKTRTVLIYGGDNMPVPAGAPARKIKAVLKSGVRVGVGVGSRLGHELPVPAGSAGGMARCAPLITPGAALKSVTCGWIHGNSVLVMSFGGFDAKSAKLLVPQIIAAVEQG